MTPEQKQRLRDARADLDEVGDLKPLVELVGEAPDLFGELIDFYLHHHPVHDPTEAVHPPSNGMPERARQALSLQLQSLISLVKQNRIMAFAFAAEIVDEDEEGTYVIPKYGHHQSSHGLIASVAKVQALLVAKGLRGDMDDPLIQTRNEDTDA